MANTKVKAEQLEAAQTNITSVGTLTALQVDNININGNTISSTDTNGNIIITPNGTGNLNLNAMVGIGTASPDVNSFGAGHGILTVQSATGSAKTAMLNLSGDGNDTDATRVASLFFNDASATGAGKSLAGIEAYRASNHATDPGGDLLFSANVSGGSYTERMRIQADGTTTIGRAITTTYVNSQGYPLHVQASGGSQTYIAISSPGANSGDTGLVIGHDATGSRIINREDEPIIFHRASGETMRIHSDGNVGIGTTAPASALHVYAATGDIGITIETAEDSGSKEPFLNLKSYATNANPVINFGDHAGYMGAIEYENQDDSMSFATNGGKRVYITSAGVVSIGDSTPESDAFASTKCLFLQGAESVQTIKNTSASDSAQRVAIGFLNSSGTGVGYISNTSSSTTFGTSSDYRLKENVTYDWEALPRLAQLKPARFNFKVDSDNTVDGFLAHEAQSIVPEAVSGEKDGKTMQGMDYGRITPLLVKAIQEQQTQIEALQAEVKALKGG